MQESLRYVRIDPENYCKYKDFEVCAVKIHFNAKRPCIIAIYRGPSSNFDLFISKLNTILRKLYTVTSEYIICGDINIDYLVHSDRKSQLEALFKTYNLTSAVNFPTCTQKHSTTAITGTWAKNVAVLVCVNICNPCMLLRILMLPLSSFCYKHTSCCH